MGSQDERALAIAAFRHRLIAEAIELDDADGTSAALTRVAERTHTDPRGRSVRFDVRTLWRWIHAYRRGGFLALRPARRKDRGQARKLTTGLVEQVEKLRRENRHRPTKTIIDILVRKRIVARGQLARSTLDRHFARVGLSRRALSSLGQQTFRKIETTTPFELVVGDFHHGPYVRLNDGSARRALLCAFIDHFSRFVPEVRYFLHEDFAALRFGFRRLVMAWGLPVRLYLDNGPAFHANRFHAACDTLGLQLVHSKPYQSEGRGLVERFNRTVLEQFETEIKNLEEAPTLDELNANLEAWLAERYHRDIHSETGESPADRFQRTAALRPAPDLDLLDESLRLRERRTVHRKWSTVEVGSIRYSVDPSLRGRRVGVLYDPFDPSYVLVSFDGRLVERASPQRPGAEPRQIPPPQSTGPPTDYLALLRADYERRTGAELAAIRLRPETHAAELSLPDLVALLELCRAAPLTPAERSEVSALWRRMRPLDPEIARTAIDRARRRLGTSLHIRVYLDLLGKSTIRSRAKERKS